MLHQSPRNQRSCRPPGYDWAFREGRFVGYSGVLAWGREDELTCRVRTGKSDDGLIDRPREDGASSVGVGIVRRHTGMPEPAGRTYSDSFCGGAISAASTTTYTASSPLVAR